MTLVRIRPSERISRLRDISGLHGEYFVDVTQRSPI